MIAPFTFEVPVPGVDGCLVDIGAGAVVRPLVPGLSADARLRLP